MAFTDFLDPVLGPLLNLHPAISIFIMSFLVTFLITIVYKYTTDQKRMKEVKDEMKKYQTEIKVLAKEGKNEKAMQIQGKAMQLNMEYMKHSFKSTLYTMLPVLLIFAWMAANMAYYPIHPSQEFTVTAYFAQGHAETASITSIPDLVLVSDATQTITYNTELKSDLAVWRLKGNPGEYKLTIDYNNEKYDQKVLITDGKKYIAPEQIIKNSKLQKIVVGNEKIIPFTIFGLKFTWFWAYLVISIILSMSIRKIMKVY